MADKSDIQAGPDTDMAVAEACGFECDVDGSDGLIIHDVPQCRWIQFSPSTDWNDAMRAAEECGVFVFGEVEGEQQYGSTFLDRVVDGGVEMWRVCRHRYNPFENALILVPMHTAPTGPLAICRAILKRKGKP